MNSGERFDEISLPNKEDLYSNLNMEEITDADYMHAKRVFKIFNKKILLIIKVYIFKVLHYYLLMYLRIFEISVVKYMNLILLTFHLHLD